MIQIFKIQGFPQTYKITLRRSAARYQDSVMIVKDEYKM